MKSVRERKILKRNLLASVVSGAVLALSNAASAFTQSYIEIPSGTAIGSDICGKPTKTTSPGLYLWMECENIEKAGQRDVYVKIVSTADATFSGTIKSNWKVVDEDGLSAELDQGVVSKYNVGSNVKGYVYDTTGATGASVDSFNFKVFYNNDAELTLNLNSSPDNTIFIGTHRKRLAVSGNENIPFYIPKATVYKELENALSKDSEDLKKDSQYLSSFYEKLNLINVKEFGAVGDGEADDTKAIQDAIDRGIRDGKTVYLPSGKYIISKPLSAMMPVTAKSDGGYKQDRRKPLTIIGSTIGEGRPVLKLRTASGDDTFANANAPVPLLRVWAQCRDGKGYDQNSDKNYNECLNDGTPGSLDPNHEQPNISFSQVIRGIDFDITNHAGAIAIRHPGSQGSMISDVKVFASGAFAGFDEIPGQGGGVYNVAIDGGYYGIRMTQATKFPQLAGLLFSNQERAAIQVQSNSPVVLAGFAVSGTPQSVVEITGANNPSTNHAGALSLVDGRINLGQGSSLLISNTADPNDGTVDAEALRKKVEKNIVIDNVFVKGGDNNLVELGGDRLGALSGYSGWQHIDIYSYTGANSQGYINSLDAHANYLDEFRDGEYLRYGTSTKPDAHETIMFRHIWDERSFPTFEHSDVVIAPKDANLNTLLAESKKVFLPTGTYRIKEPLVLDHDFALLGAGKTTSVIKRTEFFKTNGSGRPMITTTNNADSKAVLSNVMLALKPQDYTPTFVKWQAGANSIYRGNFFGGDLNLSEENLNADPAILVSENGGGRWYGVAGEWTRFQWATTAPAYRGLKIEGTTQPLAFYGLNVERVQPGVEEPEIVNPQVEVNNAENVSIYYLKGESFFLDQSNWKKGAGPDNLHVNNSNNFKLYAFGGNSDPAQSQVKLTYDDANLPKYLIANLGGSIHTAAANSADLTINSTAMVDGVLSGSLTLVDQEEQFATIGLVEETFAGENASRGIYLWLRVDTDVVDAAQTIKATVMANGRAITSKVDVPVRANKDGTEFYYQTTIANLPEKPDAVLLERKDGVEFTAAVE